MVILLLLSLTIMCSSAYYLGRHSALFEDSTKKAIADLRIKMAKTPYGDSEEPEITRATIIDPDDVNQQIEFTKRQHDETLRRLNPR